MLVNKVYFPPSELSFIKLPCYLYAGLMGGRHEIRSSQENLYQESHGLEAWLGSREGLFYMHWS